MSKGEGKKIAIKFTEDLVGDVNGNESAFTITGQEYKYVNGPLIDGNYLVEKVERYPVQRVWDMLHTNDVVTTNTELVDEGFLLATDSISTTEVEIWDSQATTNYYLCTNSSFLDRSSAKSTTAIEVTGGREYIFSSTGNRAAISWWDDSNSLIRCDHFDNNDVGPFTLVAPEGAYYVYYYFAWDVTDAEASVLSEAKDYVPQGSLLTTEPIQIDGEHILRWLENKLANTNILIEYATGQTQGQWQDVSNGDIINADTNLWIRATLSTEDTAITPILEDLWLEEPDAPQDKILLTMKPLKRFNNIEGVLTIKYDTSLGSLRGKGGPVESFEHAFTPIDLVPKLNPYITEKITATPNISTDFIKVDYNNRYASERIAATPNMSVELIKAEVVNP